MSASHADGWAAQYRARVDAVLAQRTRLRGAPPPGDLFGGLGLDHPLMQVDARRPLDPNLEAIAALIESDDVVIDVGGGAGRISLPLALRCREIVNVEPSAAMGAGFKANAAKAGIANVRLIAAEWPAAAAPAGTVALVNHVTYFARDIAAFIDKLQRAGPRRVIITVNHPPPPSWHRVLFALVHGETEAVVPGHAELANVLWESGVMPDIRVLPAASARPVIPMPNRAAAIDAAVARFAGDQWAFWPLGAELDDRVRRLLEARFDELFATGQDGFIPRWVTPGQEVLFTWQPGG